MPAHYVTVVAVFSVATGINDLKAFTQNGILFVSGLTPGRSWSVYNVYGALIYSSIANAPTAEIPLPGRGVYIVTDGIKTLKIVN